MVGLRDIFNWLTSEAKLFGISSTAQTDTTNPKLLTKHTEVVLILYSEF
jgi:hypothetical protein